MAIVFLSLASTQQPVEFGAQGWVSNYFPNVIKLSVLIFSPQLFQLLMKLTLLGELLGAALHPPVQLLPHLLVGMQWFTCM